MSEEKESNGGLGLMFMALFVVGWAVQVFAPVTIPAFGFNLIVFGTYLLTLVQLFIFVMALIGFFVGEESTIISASLKSKKYTKSLWAKSMVFLHWSLIVLVVMAGFTFLGTLALLATILRHTTYAMMNALAEQL